MTCYDLFIARQLTPSWLQSIQHLNFNPGGRVGGWVDMGVWKYWGINFCRSRVGCLTTRTRRAVSAERAAAKPFCLSLKQSELVKPAPLLRHLPLIHTSRLFNIVTFRQKAIFGKWACWSDVWKSLVFGRNDESLCSPECKIMVHLNGSQEMLLQCFGFPLVACV